MDQVHVAEDDVPHHLLRRPALPEAADGDASPRGSAMVRRRGACKDLADLYFSVAISIRNICASSLVLCFNVEINIRNMFGRSPGPPQSCASQGARGAATPNLPEKTPLAGEAADMHRPWCTWGCTCLAKATFTRKLESAIPEKQQINYPKISSPQLAAGDSERAPLPRRSTRLSTRIRREPSLMTTLSSPLSISLCWRCTSFGRRACYSRKHATSVPTRLLSFIGLMGPALNRDSTLQNQPPLSALTGLLRGDDAHAVRVVRPVLPELRVAHGDAEVPQIHAPAAHDDDLDGQKQRTPPRDNANT